MFCDRIQCYVFTFGNKIAYNSFSRMSLVAYADSDEDSSDTESSVLPSVAGQEHSGNDDDTVKEPAHFAGPAVLGQ